MLCKRHLWAIVQSDLRLKSPRVKEACLNNTCILVYDMYHDTVMTLIVFRRRLESLQSKKTHLCMVMGR